MMLAGLWSAGEARLTQAGSAFRISLLSRDTPPGSSVACSLALAWCCRPETHVTRPAPGGHCDDVSHDASHALVKQAPFVSCDFLACL